MKRDSGLFPYRRHLRACPYFGRGGREVRLDRCNCPFHVDGIHHGRRVRGSLKTRSRQTSDRNLAELIRRLDAELDQRQTKGIESASTAPEGLPDQKTVSEAAERFLASKGGFGADLRYRGDVEQSTYRKYNTSLAFLLTFCQELGISKLTDVGGEALEDFRRTREIGLGSWKGERQLLITFFGYCVSRKWISTNPAKELKAPRNLKPNEIVPYTLHEESQILAACDRIGGGKNNRSGARYEQLRARAMVLLLRHTALRISDVSTLRKDAVSWEQSKGTWRVFLHTQKTGDPVFLPMPEGLKLVLDALPVPRNAAQDCPYYFWNGTTSRRAVVGIAERTLGAVFKKSGVKDAHAHRYRHTLATRLLGQGATFEEVADILGNSPTVVRKHYGKWSKGRQDNIDRLMFQHFEIAGLTTSVTEKSHEKAGAVN